MPIYNTSENKLNFTFEKAIDSTTNISFVFKKDEIVFDTTYLDIRIIGFVYDYDRPIKIEQIETSGNTAIEGIHYFPLTHPFTADKLVIKASSNSTRVPIIIKRDPSLKEGIYNLRFRIVENEFFKLGVLNSIEKTISITDKLSKPNTWTDWMTKYGIGVYGPVKHKFMIDVTGEEVNDAYIKSMNNEYNYLQYMKGFFKEELIKVNKERELRGEKPLREAPEKGQIEGILVQFP